MGSKRRIRRKACSGKVRHETVKDANQAIFFLNKDKGYQGRMNAYKCKFCKGYHIGHG